MKDKIKVHNYKFKATIGDEIFYPKGFYYQGKHIILVGCIFSNHTIRRKEKIEDVHINIINLSFLQHFGVNVVDIKNINIEDMYNYFKSEKIQVYYSTQLGKDRLLIGTYRTTIAGFIFSEWCETESDALYQTYEILRKMKNKGK